MITPTPESDTLPVPATDEQVFAARAMADGSVAIAVDPRTALDLAFVWQHAHTHGLIDATERPLFWWDAAALKRAAAAATGTATNDQPVAYVPTHRGFAASGLMRLLTGGESS